MNTYDERRAALSRHPTLTGVDFLEVSQDQRELSVHFVPAAPGVDKTVVPQGLTIRNVEISGGVRVRNVRVMNVRTEPDRLVVTVEDDSPADGIGDFSTYDLRLVGVENLDPFFAEIPFTFKAECPTDFDCLQETECPPEVLPEPDLDYLAKDYASFRRLMLDRLSTIAPRWRERNPADLQVALVELLAYVGDHLSYQQDAVATEAYLGTARRRASVRRHARLVDYPMHDGSNARAWVQLRVEDVVQLPKGTPLLTRVPGTPTTLRPDELPATINAGVEVFETLHDATLHPVLDELELHTWGADEYCLPEGATQATLRGRVDRLRAGDFLLFEEVRGSRTGEPEDADPTRRHVVRLAEVAPSEDPLGGHLADPPTDDPTPVTEVRWPDEDALPFPVCVLARGEDGAILENVSVARANVVLADHGRTVEGETLGAVPDTPPIPRIRSGSRPVRVEPTPVLPRFRPRLREGPLTHAAPYEHPPPSAAAATRWAPGGPLPVVELEDGEGFFWRPRRDLLGSSPFDRHFVAEVETDGRARLRFGDDAFGMRPAAGTGFATRYRTGNGAGGNVGAEALAHVAAAVGAVAGVRNPLPAWGGVEPESLERVRQNAPEAFRVQERAVTPEDYAEVGGRHPGVQRAAATLRWTGSWYTVFLSVDRLGGREVDPVFEEELRRHLERFRLAGHDLEVSGPRYVPLEVEVLVCVEPRYFRGDVREALLEVLGSRTLPDGRRGLFHPDNFTFGQPVYLSKVYAAAQAVEGVASVEALRFRRRGTQDGLALEEGRLSVGRFEVVRLDNDPNFPENGVLRLILEGGK